MVMNKFTLFIKNKKRLLIIEGITAFIAGIYFNVSGKNDSSFKDLFLYIFLPLLVMPSLIEIIIFRLEKLEEDNCDCGNVLYLGETENIFIF